MSKNRDAEEFLKEPPAGSDSKTKRSKSKRDPKDVLVTRLKNINMKLRQHLKDLNNKLEVAIDKTHTVKKPIMPAKETPPEEEAMRVENTRKCIENFKKEIERLQKKDDKDELESKLVESKMRTLELEKLKHDLEVELDDFKEENRVQQHVNDSELKVWNEKIRKKKEILQVEQQLVEKRKEKIAHFEEQNRKLKDELSKCDTGSAPKSSEDEKRKLRDEILRLKKEVKGIAKKNKEKVNKSQQDASEAK